MPIICYCDAGGNNQTKSDFYGSYKVDGEVVKERMELGNVFTTNEAEYKIACLLLSYFQDKVVEDDIIIRSDSSIVVNQVNNKWRVRAKNLQWYWMGATMLIARIRYQNPGKDVILEWVPREVIVKELGH